MLTQLLEKLRHKLANSPNFLETMNFFMDEVNSQNAFHEEGELYPADSNIDAILHGAIEGILKTKEYTLIYENDIRLPKYHFSHGPFYVSGGLGLYFYFHDTGQGLIMFNIPGQQTWCSRISATFVPKGSYTDLKPIDKTPN